MMAGETGRPAWGWLVDDGTRVGLRRRRRRPLRRMAVASTSSMMMRCPTGIRRSSRPAGRWRRRQIDAVQSLACRALALRAKRRPRERRERVLDCLSFVRRGCRCEMARMGLTGETRATAARQIHGLGAIPRSVSCLQAVSFLQGLPLAE